MGEIGKIGGDGGRLGVIGGNGENCAKFGEVGGDWGRLGEWRLGEVEGD